MRCCRRRVARRAGRTPASAFARRLASDPGLRTRLTLLRAIRATPSTRRTAVDNAGGERAHRRRRPERLRRRRHAQGAIERDGELQARTDQRAGQISRASGVVVDEDYPEPFEFEALGLGQRLRVINREDLRPSSAAGQGRTIARRRVSAYDMLVLAHGLQGAQRDLVDESGVGLITSCRSASDLADWNSPRPDIVAVLTKSGGYDGGGGH